MVDKNRATTFQGEGQPQEEPATPAVSGQPTVTNAVQPQYVTMEQAAQLAKEAADDAFRRAQSLYSKSQAGFEKKVQADLKNLEKALDLQKKAGISITPEQENTMRQQVINQAFMDDGQPTQQVTSPNQPAQAGEEEGPPDPVTAAAWKIMEDAGIDDIEESDPEFSLIDENTPDAFKFLRSIEAATEAKRKRLAEQSPVQQPTRTPTNAGAGGSPINPITNINDPDALWSAVKQSGRL